MTSVEICWGTCVFLFVKHHLNLMFRTMATGARIVLRAAAR